MKTYVLIVSTHFPKGHINEGKETYFVDRIHYGSILGFTAPGYKKHTIRRNYELWKKRFEQIDKGKARLSVRIWTGKPYRSKQKEVYSFSKSDGIGVQKLEKDFGWFIDDRDSDVTNVELSANDGLTTKEFIDWFRDVKRNEPLAIIHFTPFRYQ